MIKVNLLLEVISDLRSLTDSLQAVVDGMGKEEAPAIDATTTQEEVKKEKKPSKKPGPKKQYTLEEVRGILAEKSQNGFTAEVKALIEKYGGSKLSDINAENYAALIEEAKVLGGE